MRIFLYKRILMNEADSGSGNGAAVPSTPDSPATPQAQGAAAPATLDALMSALDKRLEERDQKLHDKVFAALRRDGGLSKKPNQPSADAAPVNTQPSVTDFRSLDRALAKSGLADRLSDSAYKRLEKAFAEDSPADAHAWVKDYFDGFGTSPATQPSSQPSSPAKTEQPAAPHPVSNRGAPQAVQTPVEELNLWSASDADRKAFIAQKGVRAYVQKLQQQGKGRPVQLGKR